MPESPNPKLREAPPPNVKSVARSSCAYAELDVKTNFSFLRGASHPDELVYRAAELGYRAIGITDINSLAGVVRAHEAAKEVHLKLLVGSRLTFSDAPDLLVWASNRAGYARLCRLLTLGKRRTEKGECDLRLEDFLNGNEGLVAAVEGGMGEPWRVEDKARRHEGTEARREGRKQKSEGNLQSSICNPQFATPPAPEENQDTTDSSPSVPSLSPSSPSVPSCLRASVPFLHSLRSSLGSRLSLIATCSYGSDDSSHLRRLAELSRLHHIPLLATNAVHYHDPSRRMLQDMLTCVRHGCTVSEAGFRLFPNGERYLKSPQQMHRLFADYPQALRRGIEIAEQCDFQLDSLRYEYPDELVPAGKSPIEHLGDLAWAGATGHYPAGIPQKVRDLLNHELTLIAQLKFEAYFLTVHDLVCYARSRGILCQGRGSAANSAVCFCIGVTSVNPVEVDLLFERFISAARNEPPDIDIDFEHERREEVIQYIYEKYGRERAGMTAEVITYRGRSAVRDVGKAMGLTLDMVDTMASKLDWWHRGVLSEPQLRECGFDPADMTIRRVIALATELLGFPRHLSQHVGGMVMTRGPLCELVPIENASMPDRTVIEWDKNDIDSLGILKVDVLALGMLTCISKAFKLIREGTEGRKGDQIGGSEEKAGTEGKGLETAGTEQANHESAGRDRPRHPGPDSKPANQLTTSPSSPSCLRAFVPSCLSLASFRPTDSAVYEMMSNADTVGVFQIESRAQMSMLPRLRPNCFYDLVIEVAIVRPGPIQGNMVHPYLRRRCGEEKVIFPNEALREVLRKTLGVPLFQEQAMRIAMVAAGFTADEADKLRRAMAAWRRTSALEAFQQKIIQGMLANGYEQEFAEQCFNQIKGFGEYGFPESHAASFALLVYVSAWLKRYHPAAFAAALINSQPMGFYMPAQIVRDAKEHGVKVLPVDVNESEWDCTLEGEGTEARRHGGTKGKEAGGSGKTTWGIGGPVLRLGFRLIKGFREVNVGQIVEARGKLGRFNSIKQFHQATHLPVAALRILAEADAFGSLGLTRREALWEVLELKDEEGGLFANEGTEARRHEGTKGKEEDAIAIQGVLSIEHEATNNQEDFDDSNASRFDCLAARHAIDQEHLRDHPGNAQERTVWFGQPDAPGSSLDSVQHCGGICASEQGRLHQIPENCAGVAGRVVDPVRTIDRPETTGPEQLNHESAGRNRPCPPRPDSQPAIQITTSSPPCLPSLPSLRPDPPSSPFVPPCLRASVPSSSLLPPMPLGQEVMTDYATAGLSLKQHPVALVREELKRRKIMRSKDLDDMPNGRWVNVAGLVLIRQRPGTASGIVFETLEDETGIVNLIVKPDIYERYRLAARHAGLLQAEGYLQRQGQVVHIIAKRLFDLSALLNGHEFHSRDFH